MATKEIKGRFKKGQSGNPNGRPKGSRNKRSLVKAQLTIDNTSEHAAKLFLAIVTRDAEKLAEFGLDPKDVKIKEMIEVGKAIMSQSAGEMKALAAEEKVIRNPKDEEPSKPTFSSVATLKKSG